jgi:hypothetical protein
MVTRPTGPRRRTETSHPEPQTAAVEAVRRYLRAVVGAPLRGRGTIEEAQDGFVEVAAEWCAQSGVDRRTLLGLGVDRVVLDAAGVLQPPTHEVLRGWWPAGPFAVSDLARRSGFSESTVRQAIARDVEAGLLRRSIERGRAVLWERTD